MLFKLKDRNQVETCTLNGAQLNLPSPHFLDLIWKDDRERVGAFIEQLCQSNQPQSLECRLAIGKKVAFVVLSGFAIKTGEVLLTAYEISKYVLDSREKEYAHNLSRLLLESLPIALIVVSSMGMIRAVNPSIEKLFSWSARELAEQNVLKLFQSGEERSEHSFLALLNKLHGNSTRLTAVRKDGSTFPVELWCNPLGGDAGEMVLSVTDITEREELNRMKSEFIAMVSHDLRTPLTSLHVFLDSVANGVYGQCPPVVIKRAATAELDVVRLIGLVQHLLKLEQIEEGRLELNRTRFAAEALTTRAVGAVQALAHSRGIEIEAAVADTFLDADEEQLVQVLVNFLGNAIKFSPNGERIHIKMIEEDGGLYAEVSDHGPGIPSEYCDRIFERYEQVKNSKLRSQGTGLGLAICKSIIEAHGGQIGVTSQEGSGSSFWFRIPLHQAR